MSRPTGPGCDSDAERDPPTSLHAWLENFLFSPRFNLPGAFSKEPQGDGFADPPCPQPSSLFGLSEDVDPIELQENGTIVPGLCAVDPSTFEVLSHWQADNSFETFNL
jgi:hypothetical protein